MDLIVSDKLVKNKKRFHIIFWILYLFLEINLEFAWSKFEMPNIVWYLRLYFSFVTETTFLLIKIPLVYFIFKVIDNEKLRLSFLIQLLFIISAFIIAIFLHRIVVHDIFWPVLYEKMEKMDRFHFIGLLNAFMDLLFVVGIIFGFEKFRQQIDWKEQIAILHAEKMETELKFLKTQINPHFLFNTLNNIYGLALKRDTDTPDIILKLSKIMRYNIYDSSNKEVTLYQEIENIKDFIDIQKIRFRNLKINFIEVIEDASQKIAPLILLQFIENAFKHGASESRFEAFISINILLKDKELFFVVENSKEIGTDQLSSKIGLLNIQRQLELLYPKKHKLTIQETDTVFRLQLLLNFAI